MDKTPQATKQRQINVRTTASSASQMGYATEDTFIGDGLMFLTNGGDGMLRIKQHNGDVTAVYAPGCWAEVWVA